MYLSRHIESSFDIVVASLSIRTKLLSNFENDSFLHIPTVVIIIIVEVRLCIFLLSSPKQFAECSQNWGTFRWQNGALKLFFNFSYPIYDNTLVLAIRSTPRFAAARWRAHSDFATIDIASHHIVIPY